MNVNMFLYTIGYTVVMLVAFVVIARIYVLADKKEDPAQAVVPWFYKNQEQRKIREELEKLG